MNQNINQNQVDFNNNINNLQNLDSDNLIGMMNNLSLENYQNSFFPFNLSSNNNNNIQNINSFPNTSNQNVGLNNDIINFNFNQQGLLNK